MEISQHIATIESTWGQARQRGLQFLTCDDERLRGRRVRVHGREVTFFASCSYLGLEFHPALVEGTIDATRRYGTQFSSSRAWMSAPAYAQAEEALAEIFGAPTLLTSSMSLGHQSVLPVLATEHDALVMDNQAHQSIQAAATLARANGARMVTVRHRELDDRLLDTVADLARRHRTVYVCGDGVYSMYGDLAPLRLLRQALDVAPNVRLYVDDAHGMSWTGEHGRGFFLSRMPASPRVVLATSLNKAFAAAGGAFVFADEAELERVRLAGAPQSFSGPVQPPMLGAVLGSARVHLSGEIGELQRAYRERVDLCNRLMEAHDLPLLSRNDSPIFFLRLGKNEAAHALAERLLDEGHYVGISSYPTVPVRRAGLRLTITALHTPDEIESVAQAMAHHLPRVLEEHGVSREELDELYRGALPAESWGGIGPRREQAAAPGPVAVRREPEVPVECYDSIQQVDAAAWDGWMAGHGVSSWEALAAAERAFRGHDRPEHNWEWRYFLARGADGEVLGATYCTRCLVKDDMFMRARVSEAAEERRGADPYFLTTPALMLGSLLSEGRHVWLAPGPRREAVLEALVAAAEAQAAAWDVDTVFLRDFPADDPAMDRWMDRRDWIKVPILDTQRIDLAGRSEEALLAGSGKRTRRFLRELVAASGDYAPRVYGAGAEPLPDAWVEHLHGLYENVRRRNRRINDFGVPASLLPHLLESPAWEVLALHLDPEKGGPADGRPVSWIACHRAGTHYAPLVCGVDYAYVEDREYGAYRQLMLQTVRRARALGMETVHFGFDAELEKRRLGAVSVPTCVYVRPRRHDHGERMQQFVTRLGLHERRGAGAGA